MRFVLGRDSIDIGRPGIDSSSPPCEPDECTIVRRNGEVCGQPVSDDTNVSVCDHHAWKIYHQLDTGRLRADVRENQASIAVEDAVQRRRLAHDREAQDRSVVYYAGNRGTIKIGRTINLKQRLMGLRIDPKWLMAIEPGSYAIETQRLHQFAHLRYGRTEDFDPGEDLIAHIKALRATYEVPKL